MLAPGLKLAQNLPRELNSIHQHLMIPHHILQINLSFVRCCMQHPPQKKSATWIPWMQEMEPNDILKQVGKSDCQPARFELLRARLHWQPLPLLQRDSEEVVAKRLNI